MTQQYNCPLGCVFNIQYRDEIMIHLKRHAINLESLMLYRRDLIPEKWNDTYQDILDRLQEVIEQIPNPLPNSYQYPTGLCFTYQ